MRARIFIRHSAAAALMTAGLASAAAAQVVAPVDRLSMDDAVKMALARNRSMWAQRLAIEPAKADETTAALKPNLNVSFGVAGFTPFTPSSVNWDFLKNGA